jgi:hypothetical protein
MPYLNKHVICTSNNQLHKTNTTVLYQYNDASLNRQSIGGFV